MPHIQFGGPNLPIGTHTWWDHKDGRTLRANPGDVVCVDDMVFPEYYVQTGRAKPYTPKPAATIAVEPTPEPAPADVPADEPADEPHETT